MLTAFAQLDQTSRMVVIAFVAGVAFVVRRVYLAWRWPYITCSGCTEDKRSSPDGKRHGDCRKCGNTGQKLCFTAQLLGFGNSPNQPGGK
ncbi:hypothetical protein [Amycolatopsis sp. NPDC004079]|uniref:hypothetical protein n=1 Tax=Amycolatopsis sp. NPDC004079 TaxID=3154549 RepID=UPI0033B65BAD